MFNSLFKIVYFVELILITAVRSAGTAKYRRTGLGENRSDTRDKILHIINGAGMVVPLIYVFSSWLDFANYSLPAWISWIGAVLFIGAAVLLWATHRDMGRYWTPNLGLREDHQLVTEGVFSRIRHPMYAAHLLWAVAQPLLLTNWIAGFSFLIPQILQHWLRVKPEEKMMLDTFGDQYQSYMEKTGRYIPKL